MFARYNKVQAKKKAEEAAKSAKNAQIRQLLTLALTVLLFVALGGAGYYYLDRQKPDPQIAQNVAKPTQPKAVQSPKKAAPNTNQQKATTTRKKDFFAIAKQAIVVIKTPWGTGSGFFIQKDLIVTSKYLVEYSDESYEKYINEVGQSRRSVEQEAEKLRELKISYEEITDGTPKDELAAEIEEREELLNDALLKQQEREDQLDDKADIIAAPEIVIYLPDGSVVQMIDMTTSSTYDLALLSVYEVDAPSIELPPEGTSLAPGDTVYSLGPGNMAIKGTFTQYYQGNDPTEDYLQTDAQINLKYSGAPLINEKGYAFGVSTTTLANEDGLGSAIPIETVFNEFNL